MSEEIEGSPTEGLSESIARAVAEKLSIELDEYYRYPTKEEGYHACSSRLRFLRVNLKFNGEVISSSSIQDGYES